MPKRPTIVAAGRNAWRVCRASRAALLVDGAAYFDAVAAAFEAAERSIVILGWDFNSDIELRRTEKGETLGALMNRVLSHQRRLHIHVLVWDFATIYALERDLLPLFNLALRGRPRLHFHMDDRHPLAASHHQKVVVVDDALAFSGGFDLTKNRWDTPEHGAEDSRRVDTAGKAYAPFHDVQIVVDGDAAAALGELARDRWRRATGRRLRAPEGARGDPWPRHVTPDVENVDVAISRTLPAHGDQREAREVERLYVDVIAAARDYIYVENQYFTSNTIFEALAAKLSERDGPDIVMVMPSRCSGWLEETTMGLLRTRILDALRKVDHAGRLRVYAPVVPGADPCEVFVHAKVLVSDDRMLRIGSANLSNRSMGLDTECDLSVEAVDRADVESAIARFRDRLLAEHLGVEPERVAASVEREGSLVAAVEKLRGKARTLQPVDPDPAGWSESIAGTISLIDPERPVDPDELVRLFSPGDAPGEKGRLWLRLAAVASVLVGLALIWRFSPLQELVTVERLSVWAETLRGHPLAPLVVVGIFIAGSLVMFPLMLLIAATATTFEPVTAMAYALSGTLSSAALTYWLGRKVGRGVIRKLAGAKLNRLSRRLSKRGLATMTAARIVPIAPFTVVNMVAGACRIRFRDFLLGSFFGILPGILAITVLEKRLEGLIREPSVTGLVWMGVTLVVVVLAFFGLRRRFVSEDAA